MFKKVVAMKNKIIKILLIEDEETHAFLLKKNTGGWAFQWIPYH
jgi:hypothetical protein